MSNKVKVIKVVSRGPVVSVPGTGLNRFGQPATPGPVAPTPQRRKVINSGQR